MDADRSQIIDLVGEKGLGIARNRQYAYLYTL